MSDVDLAREIQDAVDVAVANVSGFEVDMASIQRSIAAVRPSVRSRLKAVWDLTCSLHRWAPEESNQVRMYGEVVKILAEQDLEVSLEQQRILRWVCGYEWDTVAALVELMVAGREAEL